MQITEELLDIEGIKKSKKSLLDLFIRRTAVLTSTDENMVELIIKDQWRNANKQTSVNTSVSELDFPNLGTFYMSKPKANKRLAKIYKYMDSLSTQEESDKKTKSIEDHIKFIADIKNKIKSE